MSQGSGKAGSLEPAITRLQLELNVRRKAAEACLRAGYRTAVEVAAADDREFHERVALDAREREEVLAHARAPGSRPLTAGERPVLTRERRPADKVLAIAKPVANRIVKLAGEVEPAPP